MTEGSGIAAVVIGRNEGARLIRCLESLQGRVDRLVYVDSGSTDGSVAAAEARGAEVVALDTSQGFTAARARNAGLSAATDQGAAPVYVQFVDGDCEVQPDWIEKARAFLEAHPRAAVVCGRRRERFPEASVYNRLIDVEWDTPVGEAKACGGDALMRVAALEEVGGYDPALIAGEEPELCLRLRRKGWTVWRIDAEMTLHDADIHRFDQWWRRTRRAGHAYAEGAAMYGTGPERHKVRERNSALLWGAVLPVAGILGSLVTPWAAALLLAYPAQVLRLTAKGLDARQAFFLVLGKFPEAAGVIGYHLTRARGRKSRLIEYK
jgi:GT2 family glycosyltransferase